MWSTPLQPASSVDGLFCTMTHSPSPQPERGETLEDRSRLHSRAERRSWPFRLICILLNLGLGLFLGLMLALHNSQLPCQLSSFSLYYQRHGPGPPTPSLLSNLSNSPTSISTLPFNDMLGLHLWRERLGPYHNLSDLDLLWLSSMPPMPQGMPLQRVPKLAFMFLSRGELPFTPLWERFFNGNEGLYSIYLHTDPHFTLNVAPSSVFYRRQIPSKATKYGDISLLNSERRLLANALFDLSNERFILLSESCIPLYNFSFIYEYVLHSKHSFVESYDEVGRCGRGRYDVKMAPLITLSQWRKGSQWFTLDRNLARSIGTDTIYHSLFEQYCKVGCYNDEHYIPTMFNIMNLSSQIAYRTITWVEWSKPGPHPTTFEGSDISEGLLRSIREVKNCYYNAQGGHICFLFARKFASSTLIPLLELASNVLGI